VEVQSARYQQGLPPALPAWRRPLPFAYESTGLETYFTSGLDPDALARNAFAFRGPTSMIPAKPEAESCESPEKARVIDQQAEPASRLVRDRLRKINDLLQSTPRP
jgi:hypothetical protein